MPKADIKGLIPAKIYHFYGAESAISLNFWTPIPKNVLLNREKKTFNFSPPKNLTLKNCCQK